MGGEDEHQSLNSRYHIKAPFIEFHQCYKIPVKYHIKTLVIEFQVSHQSTNYWISGKYHIKVPTIEISYQSANVTIIS